MKKLAVFVSAALCSLSAFAVNGPYLGVGLGYTNIAFDREEHSSDSSWDKGNTSINGFQGQLVFGYAYDINKYRLGAEIFAQGPKITHVDEASTGDRDTYTFQYSYGFNFVPGYYVTDSNLIYLKLGVTRGKFGLKDIDVQTPSSNTLVTTYDAFNTSFYSTGMNLGLGTEMYLTKNIGLKLEYLYTRYEEKTFNSIAGPAVVDKLRPQMNTFMLGLDYQF